MARMKTKQRAKRKGKNIKKILCIVVLVLSILLLAADIGFYTVTGKISSQMQNFSFSTNGSFPGMSFDEESTESADMTMPSKMPSGGHGGSGSDTVSDGTTGSSSDGTTGAASDDSAGGKPSMPSGGPGGSDSDAASDDSAGGKPSMPSGGPGGSGSNAASDGTTGSASDSDTAGDSGTGMPSIPSGNSGDNGNNSSYDFASGMPSMNTEVVTGFSKLLAIRKFCIPAAIVLALIALLCIILLIRINRQEKKRKARLLIGKNGEEDVYGEDGRLLTEEEAEAEAARLAVEESIAKRSRAKRRNAVLAFILVLLLVLLAVGSSYIKSETSRENTSINTETLSGTVEKGSLNTTLHGYGTLTAEESTDVTIPGSIDVVSYAVSNGDTVEEGDLIATIDKTTVLSSIAELQTLMDELDAELDEVSDETISDEVTAAADGRIMAIYAEEDTSVVDTMYADQALMILSLDGLMAIDFSADSEDTSAQTSGQSSSAGKYTVGTAITIETEDGDTFTGRVANIDNNTITVTVTDEGTQLDEVVTLKDSDGNTITSGKLYVHSPLKVTGFAGTVDEIEVAVGDEVEAGDTLLTLTDTEYSANYDTMVQQREVLENQMSALMRAYMTGGVYADQKGVISGIDTTTAMNSENGSDTGLSYTGIAYGTEGEGQTIYSATLAAEGEDTTSGSDTSAASGASDNSQESSADSGESETTGGNTSDSTTGGNITGESTTGESTTGGDTAGGNTSGGSETEAETGKTTDTETTGALTAEQLSELVEWLLKLDSATLNQILSQLDYSVLKPIYDVMIGYKSSHSSTDGDTTGETEQGGTIPGTEAGGTEAGTTTGGGTLPSGSDSTGTGTSSGTDLSSLVGSLTGGSSTSGVSSANISASAASAILSSSEAAAAEGTEEDSTKTYTFSETELCTLTPDDTMTIDITVDELDILSVLVNTGVQVTLDAFEGQSFDGTITYIDTDGANSGGDTKYTVTVTIDRTEDMLTGMNANVNIILDTTDNILTVPVAAIFEEGETAFIYTGYDEKKDELTDPVEITTGRSDGTNAEILSGMEEGDTYYYQYAGTVIYNFVN